MCLEKRGMMCWASIFNGRFSGSIKVLKYVLKKYAVRCECHCYSKPVQSIQAIVDSAWSGAARWEQTAWAALAELFPWTAIFVTWISLISIACSWFYKSKQVFHCWAWNFWLCRPNSFPTTFSPLKLVKYCLKLSAELKKWAPETLRAPLCVTVGSLAFQWELIQLLSQTASALPQSWRDGSVWFLAQLPLSQAHAFSDHRPLFSLSHNSKKASKYLSWCPLAQRNEKENKTKNLFINPARVFDLARAKLWLSLEDSV